MMKPDPQVYRAAAEYLRKNGWTKGNLLVSPEEVMVDPSKNVGQSCVNGALLIAMGLDPVYENYSKLQSVSKELVKTFDIPDDYAIKFGVWTYRVEMINDRHGQTEEEIIAALLETAARIEREAFTQSLQDTEDES